MSWSPRLELRRLSGLLWLIVLLSGPQWHGQAASTDDPSDQGLKEPVTREPVTREPHAGVKPAAGSASPSTSNAAGGAGSAGTGAGQGAGSGVVPATTGGAAGGSAASGGAAGGGASGGGAVGGTSVSGGAVVPASGAVDAAPSRVMPRPQWLTPFQLELLRQAVPVLLVDARDRVDFYSGHIPGAIHLPWSALTAEGCGLRCGLMETDLQTIQAELTRRGFLLTERTRVVVYGDGPEGMGEEGRAFWSLEYLGVEHVAMLSGGYPRWRAEGHPAERLGSSVTPVGLPFVPRPRPELLMTRQALKGMLKRPDVVLVDTRDAEEFRGSRSSFMGSGGHLPGAVNLPWKLLLTENGELRSEAELRARLKVLGITPERQIVTYCSGGVRSAFVYLVLRTLGYPNVSNYAGSLWDWTSDPSLPVE